MELVDLSVPVETGMPVYPGDPEVSVAPALTVARDGVNVLGLHLGSQSGTHVDAPFHVDDALPRLDELPLSRFAGPAVVVDARGLAPRTPIGVE
ncbi:MAG: cyclase family protein, partial [Nonomuraea sp.]|nr:cyclase family protein [Nonomuraea sp.]